MTCPVCSTQIDTVSMGTAPIGEPVPPMKARVEPCGHEVWPREIEWR